MDSEQLKQEVEDKGIIYADSLKVGIKVEDGVEGYAWYQVEQAYERGALDFAEPRERKIAEAKKIIKDLLDTQYRLDPYIDVFKDRITAAEQFISEAEK